MIPPHTPPSRHGTVGKLVSQPPPHSGLKGVINFLSHPRRQGKEASTAKQRAPTAWVAHKPALEKLQLGKRQPRCSSPLPSPLQNSHPHKPSVSQMGTFQLRSHLVPLLQQLASCPWSSLEEPTLNLEPPSWSSCILRQAQGPLSWKHNPPTLPSDAHTQSTTTKTRSYTEKGKSDYAESSSKMSLDPACPFLSIHTLTGWSMPEGSQHAVKGQRVNILASAGYTVSAATTQGWHACARAAIDHSEMNKQGCIPTQLDCGHWHLNFLQFLHVGTCFLSSLAAQEGVADYHSVDISFPDLSNVLLPGLPDTSYYLPVKSTCSILPGQIYPIIPL